MPYKDSEKAKEYNKERMRRARAVQPDVCATQDVQPEAAWREITKKVAQGGEVEFSPSELTTILQWGIDQGKIRPRRRVAEHYGLTQKYGVARCDRHELVDLLNQDIKRKKIDTPLYFLDAVAPMQSLANAFMYSDEW